MDSNTPPLNFDLHIEDGVWKVYYDHTSQTLDAPPNDVSSKVQRQAGLMWIGTAIGPKALTREEALEVIRRIVLLRPSLPTSMTVAEFVEKKFVPTYLASRSASTRINYRSILKHIVDPELVDRAFGDEAPREGRRIRFIAGWPYLGNLRLNEVRADSVQNLITAAIKSGYSMHTVSQMRNAICMIFSFAAGEKDFAGNNPARLLEWPGLRRRSSFQDVNRGGGARLFPH